MKKNNYIKPNMVVVKLKHQPLLQVISPPEPEPGGAPGFDLDEEEVF